MTRDRHDAAGRPALIAGFATPPATQAYAQGVAGQTADGHFSDFTRQRIRLSSIGVGTFPGAATPDTDQRVAEIVSRALCQGLNVIDCAAHYRYGRALPAVGAGLREAMAAGVSREAVFLISKGGFLTYDGGRPADPEAWFEQHITAAGLGSREDLAKGAHLLSPAYIDYQIERSRVEMGVETLDAFLVDQPEVHIPEIGKEHLNRKLVGVFTQLERAVQERRIRYYGISTYDGFRVETDDARFQSIPALLGLAERAAREATGQERARHHFKLVQLPFNQVMLEGFTRFNCATGAGNVAATLQACHQLNVYVMASHTMLKGHLARESLDVVSRSLAGLANPAQRALQFNRSTPGLGTTLVGISDPAHLDDALAVAKIAPVERKAYLSMYQRAE
ncbi:MAG: oxidoreductase [Chromatiales bacterium 21-64-14]|nr:MAG: oxidoreductase [Chromatiales bacterium 21-64-14]HQU16931.1 aldo/keto reductase [Gammaproteobacteria bacterium]